MYVTNCEACRLDPFAGSEYKINVFSGVSLQGQTVCSPSDQQAHCMRMRARAWCMAWWQATSIATKFSSESTAKF